MGRALVVPGYLGKAEMVIWFLTGNERKCSRIDCGNAFIVMNIKLWWIAYNGLQRVNIMAYELYFNNFLKGKRLTYSTIT